MAVDWVLAIQVAVLLVGAAFSAKALGSEYRRKVLIPKLTILDDIPVLAIPKTGHKLKGNAVIAGGSVAGLYAAAVCSRHFEQVIVVEPEILDVSESPSARETAVSSEGYATYTKKRTRIMQYDASHGFQPIHLMALKKLFPHLEEEMEKLGIKPGTTRLNSHVGGKAVPSPYDTLDEFPKTIIVTRHCFEVLLRRLILLDYPNIRFIHGTVTNLETAATDSSIVIGASIRKAGTQEEYTEKTGLIVDATGASQAGFRRWLPHLGLALPDSLREQYDPKWNVMSCYITIPSNLQDALGLPGGFETQRWHYIGIPVPQTEERRALLVARLESDILHIMVGGWGIDNHPTTLAGIREYGETLTGSLPKWLFAMLDTLVEHADELNPIFVDHKTGPLSVIKYHLAPKGLIPDNFIAIGDAVMVTNPGYGQGCSKALIGAVTLDRHLRESTHTYYFSFTVPKNFSKDFFKMHYARIGGLWNASKTTDYGYKTTTPVEGEDRSLLSRERTFFGRVLQLVTVDRDVARTSFLVRMFLAPATDLFSPDILLKVVWHTIKRVISG